MNAPLVPSSREARRESLLKWCFSTEPVLEDWAAVLAHPEVLDLDRLTDEMAALGPKTRREAVEKTLQAWRLQQKIRLAVRYRRGLPLVTSHKCGRCGTNPTDPVLSVCLRCAERDEQILSFGSRGGCHYLRPAYDPGAKCWALLSYRSFLTSGSRSPIILYAASGYPDCASAIAALLPLSNYARLMQSATVYYLDSDSVINYMELVARKLPMTPQQRADFTREQILAHDDAFTQDSISHDIERALDDLRRQDRTARGAEEE